jgi:ribosome-associated toxin RatA of RatAB toxin-antitoxin module
MFQQVEGDFDSFQGKWTLEPLGAQHTLLKYLVDTRMHKDSLLAEALVEEVCDQLLQWREEFFLPNLYICLLKGFLSSFSGHI